MSGRPEPEGSPGVYTQINFLFKPGSIELPSGEKFKEFPEPAQKAILEAFQAEQQHRREWIRTQQHHDHELNLLRQRHTFQFRMASLADGFFLVIASLAGGVWLIHSGTTPYGVGVILVGAAGLIGTGIRARGVQGGPVSKEEPSEPRKLEASPGRETPGRIRS